tara:strand:+ start:194 stop:409 length:216 start_codon:yes stop_codon:yes gene_type:complete
MKCTTKTENTARLIVGGIIATLLFTLYMLCWIFITKLFAVMHLAALVSISLVLITSWLSGEISFCKGEEDV